MEECVIIIMGEYGDGDGEWTGWTGRSVSGRLGGTHRLETGNGGRRKK